MRSSLILLFYLLIVQWRVGCTQSDIHNTAFIFPFEVFDVHETCYYCEDKREECQEWARAGHCENYAHFMIKNCRQSCHACENDETDFEFDMGAPQILHDEEVGDEAFTDALLDLYERSQDHLRAVARNPDIRPVLPHCKNLEPLCTYWALLGECEDNQYYMQTYCCPACQAAGQLDFLLRCPMDMEEPNAWEPGDLDDFFEDLTTFEDFKAFKPHVHSRPTYLPGDSRRTANYKLGPWVVTLEEFLTIEETDRLIELALETGLVRSLDGGELRPDGTADAVVIEGRTSTQTYCTGDCYNDPIVRNVTDRITWLTNIPEENADYLQMLRYQVGQRYHTHHDYHSYQMYTASGVRMLTVYMYLNDVERGGGTDFPDLGITVMPKRGKALIWPSVLNEDPDRWDVRTHHQALPVKKGTKFGVNIWLHRRGFKTAAEYGCAE